MKRAFTIAEFILCLVIMFMIMASCITIPFKKKRQTNFALGFHDSIVCSCADPEVAQNEYECRFEIKKHTGRYEFHTIQLLGGGAAGGTEKGGAAGEAKIIHYPTMEGEYIIKLGKGGEFESGNLNGGATALYKVVKLNPKDPPEPDPATGIVPPSATERYELVEFALGGMGANEKIDEAAEIIETDPDKIDEALDKLKLGEVPNFGTENAASICGTGGNVEEDGQYGEAIIRW